jgi:hypothetical protein
MDLVWNYWWTQYLHPTMWHVIALMAVVLLFRSRRTPSILLLLNVLLLLASVSFILLFFRKLADHDYYFLTVLPTLAILFLSGIWTMFVLTSRSWWRWSLTAGIWVLAVSSVILAHAQLQRRIERTPDEYSKTASLVAGLSIEASRLDLPLSVRVIVVGDSTTNGALLSIARKGWTYPGFPVPAEPDLQGLLSQGASHVLYLGNVPYLPIPAVRVKESPTWSLWRITERSAAP